MIAPPSDLSDSLTVETYLSQWLERHGRVNLRPSSVASYACVIRNYIAPYLGAVRLSNLTAPMIDDLLAALLERGLSPGVVRLARKTLGAALEQARKYRYIDQNPIKDLLTRLPKDGPTPEPYTVPQLQQLISRVIGTRWEMPVVLAGLYGLRLGEVLGLRWDHVDLEKGTFSVCEQLPYRVAAGTTMLDERLAPVKSQTRELPITAAVRPYFLDQKQQQERRRSLAGLGGGTYYNNRLVVAMENGAPYRRERVSNDFGRLLRALEMPHIRFHDLRHSAATNMHELTGDFFTVGAILGHSLRGTGMELEFPTGLDATTARYVSVRVDRKRAVLTTYHRAVFPDVALVKVHKKR